ncbi:hypothetical protein PR202_gb00171 [Eleusine coracana subsp. coracana]|uniref:Uncharacterized protein n=1 Tax=Eleusine coracana subsp. coracana TaxID=191504 RepID=A0AAV5DT19_ELECO|nr:hypothetical protein PR202_gb00171 [Eleusine coracana subsp. coracana]
MDLCDATEPRRGQVGGRVRRGHRCRRRRRRSQEEGGSRGGELHAGDGGILKATRAVGRAQPRGDLLDQACRSVVLMGRAPRCRRRGSHQHMGDRGSYSTYYPMMGSVTDGGAATVAHFWWPPPLPLVAGAPVLFSARRIHTQPLRSPPSIVQPPKGKFLSTAS